MSAIEKWTQCGQVSPFWIDIGWVQWAGSPGREKLFNIVYRRCTQSPLPPITIDGFVCHLCAEHLKDRAVPQP